MYQNNQSWTGEQWFYFILVYTIWTIINAKVAKNKNRDVAEAIIVSIFCSPLASYLYLLASPVRTKEDAEPKQIKKGSSSGDDD